jgi:hypothetical protein
VTKVSSTQSGRLSPPFTSASITFRTAAGQASADVSWSGDATLRVDLVCGPASTDQIAANGVFVAVDAPAGTCTLRISEAVETDAVVTYTAFVTHGATS